MLLDSRRTLLRVPDRPLLVRSRFQAYLDQSRPADNRHEWWPEWFVPMWINFYAFWLYFCLHLNIVPSVVATHIQVTANRPSPTDTERPDQVFLARPCRRDLLFVLFCPEVLHHLCHPFHRGVPLDRESHRFPNYYKSEYFFKIFIPLIYRKSWIASLALRASFTLGALNCVTWN